MLEQGRYASGSSKHLCGIANMVAIDLSILTAAAGWLKLHLFTEPH
jgi:hypothetical protein